MRPCGSIFQADLASGPFVAGQPRTAQVGAVAQLMIEQVATEHGEAARGGPVWRMVWMSERCSSRGRCGRQSLPETGRCRGPGRKDVDPVGLPGSAVGEAVAVLGMGISRIVPCGKTFSRFACSQGRPFPVEAREGP